MSDARGATPKTLARLVRDEEPAVGYADAFAETSIAGRGLFAAERPLFDEAFAGPSDYRRRLILAVALDPARNSEAILELWRREHAPLALSAGEPTDEPHIDAADPTRALFDALLGGLQATADLQLGRPLRNVALSLEAAAAFSRRPSRRPCRKTGRRRSTPTPPTEAVEDPGRRIRLEAFRREIARLRETIAAAIGPALSVAPGFNALDGD